MSEAEREMQKGTRKEGIIVQVKQEKKELKINSSEEEEGSIIWIIVIKGNKWYIGTVYCKNMTIMKEKLQDTIEINGDDYVTVGEDFNSRIGKKWKKRQNRR